MAEIICRPEFIMTNYTGGGSLPRSFFAVCHAPTIDGDAFAVVSPSYQGSFLFQLFETRWLFIAWWMSLNASSVADPTPNYMPPPMRYAT